MIKTLSETVLAAIRPRGLIALAAMASLAPHAQAAIAPATVPPATVQSHSLSAADMFWQADWVVKLVMLGLLVASLVTWTVFIAKQRELARAVRVERERLAALRAMRSMGDAAETLAADPVLAAAREELTLSADALDDREGVKERIASRLERHGSVTARRLTRGIAILATIGATAPFVGLFGTVWGIMNAFVGIAEEQTTNLAVVAPGIAEALLATAMGLVAAIPAVIIYNHFSRLVASHRAAVTDSCAVVMQMVSRDLSRGVTGAA